MTDGAEHPNAVLLAALAANGEKHRPLVESIFGAVEPAAPDVAEDDE